MRITYVILAHQNPRQLLRLINTLYMDGVKFVIHVDSRADLQSFKSILNSSDQKYVHFISKRCATSWGSYEIVQATLNCFQYVRRRIPETNRVVVLSGQDYPIKNNKYILSYLSSNPNAIFIQYFKLPHAKWKEGGKPRFPYFEEISRSITIYAGSQWMSFPISTIHLIFAFLKVNPDFISYFQAVKIPDESFFQTLLLNCGEDMILQNLVNKSLHLIKWDPPFRHPRILSEMDLNVIKRSKALFARKFDSLQNSTSILDKIELEILSQVFKEKIRHISIQNTGGDGKGCILFYSDKRNKKIVNLYKGLKNESSTIANAFFVYHKKQKAVPPSLENDLTFGFNKPAIKKRPSPRMASDFSVGSPISPLFQFYRQFPLYPYYWFIEEGVRFNGNWHEFFNSFSEHNVQSDFLSYHIRKYHDEPYWRWWSTLNHISGEIIPYKERLRSFNPIFRISNNALAFLEAAFSSGWSGHDEVALPTLLNSAGYAINDFGRQGQFVIPQFPITLYQSAFIDPFGSLTSGSIRKSPLVEPIEINRKQLYYPVKN